MTKKQMKKFKEAKKHEAEIRQFYSNFAEKMGAKLTGFDLIEEDLFGDGEPRCITVFKKQA